MADILQLEHFFLIRMNLECKFPKTQPEDPEPTVNHSFNVDYKVGRRADDPNRFRLSLLLDIEPEEYGWEVHAQLDGFFRTPEELDQPKKEGLVRVNGGTILYGLLRGQLSTMTGSFPDGPIILPTVNMAEIVRRKEEQAGHAVISKTDE